MVSMGSDKGQATVEYLLVGLALMAVIAGMGALFRGFHGGAPAQKASHSASHTLDQPRGGGADDILAF